MVVLGSRDASLPGRYWGEGQGPTASPSQASFLLARLNERARERKAGLGKGSQRAGQGRAGMGQGGTPAQDKIPREHKQEGLAITPKSQHHSQTPVSQPSEDVRPKVNGVKEEEPWSEKAESVKKKKKKKKEEKQVEGIGVWGIQEIATGERLVSVQDEDGESRVVKKKKKRRGAEDIEGTGVSETQEIATGERESLVSLEDEEVGAEGSVVKKKKKKRKREESLKEEEVEGVVPCQREGLVSLQDEDSEAPVTKKKKKKRKGEEEEALKREEVGASKPVISGYLQDTEESSLIKKKKKKKKHEEHVNEEENSAGADEGSSLKGKKKHAHENEEEEASGVGEESFSEGPANQRQKKRRRDAEGVDKIIKTEMTDSGEINDTQHEHSDIPSSPTKKKSKKDIKLEPKEDDSQQVSSSPIKVPKIKIKQEIVDTAEAFKMEQQEEEPRVDSIEEGNKEAKGKEANKKKDKKKEKKKKTKKKEGKGKSREVEGFTLLTEVEATRRQKVQRTLPHWLANPTVIGRDLMADGGPVDSLPGLDPSLRDLLKQQNVKQLFPVQKAVIPEILAGAGSLACRFQPRDVCVSAPTGSGKTLAYVLPIVQALRSRTVPRIRALVLLPVQELATQVFHVFQTYCRGTPLRVGKAVGQSTFQKEQTALVAHHLDRHHSLVDILVATPGRLADHLRMTRGLDLSALRYLVLDEADRMLAAEGGDWVAHVQRAITDHRTVWEGQPLPQPPLQRLLFSATLSSDPEQLQHVTLYHPKLFTVAAPAAGQDKSVAVVIGQYVRPEELKEEYVVVEEEVKPLALHHLLVSGEGRHRVLIFTNSIQATHKLALLLSALSQGSSRVVAEFSSKRDKRQQILSQFSSGKIDVLVSSDAMARGLDIPDIDHVVSYDVTAPTTYVHRIGRTARAGQPGTALSIVTKSTMSEFRKALSGGGEGATQLPLTPDELEPYEQQYIDALASLKATLEEEEQEKRQNHSNGKAKKKKKQRKRQRKQKKDMRTARLAQRKVTENKGKVSVNANRLRRLKRP